MTGGTEVGAVIELRGVSKVYESADRRAVVKDVTASVEHGEFVSVMGPSGSGKSTLLHLIAGLDRPSAGTICVGGLELAGLSEGRLAHHRREHLGFIFQFFNLLANLRVLENVLIPAQLAGVPQRTAVKRAHELLEQLGIADRRSHYPAQLSGGERQRVAIARALINSPTVLLADEPTGALDSRSGDHVMDLLGKLNAAGQTIVLVTHDARLATLHARRILTLRDGRLVDDSAVAHRPAAAARLLTVAETGGDR
jgi:putative ABC transport system ATP-binding protein